MLHPKTAAAGIAGSVTIIVVWAASLAGVVVPPEVASAITAVCAFAASYVKGN